MPFGRCLNCSIVGRWSSNTNVPGHHVEIYRQNQGQEARGEWFLLSDICKPIVYYRADGSWSSAFYWGCSSSGSDRQNSPTHTFLAVRNGTMCSPQARTSMMVSAVVSATPTSWSLTTGD